MAIELKIDAAPGHFLAGASLPATVTLRNADSKPLDAPSVRGPNVFEYRLKALDPQGRSYSLSSLAAKTQRIDDQMPRRQVPLVPLPAGSSRSYANDLASLSTGALAPGHYQLSAAFVAPGGLVESPAVPVQIVAPRLRAVSTVSAVQGPRLGQVVVDASSPDHLSILQRESRDDIPGDGNLFVRQTLPATDPLQGVAVAAEGEPANGVRWFAWLLNTPAGATLGAGVAQSDTVFKRIDPISLGVPKGAVSPTGWQGNQESASFTALAQGADGHLKLVLAAFSATGQSGVRTVDLAGMAMPSRWLTRFHGAGSPLKIDLVSVEVQGGRTRVINRLVDFGAGRVAAPVVLGEGSDAVVALALEPVKGQGADVVDVLYATAGSPPRMLFRRLPLAGGQPLEESSFGVPVDASGQAPVDWQISPPAHALRVAVARFGNQLIGRHLATGGKGFVLDGQAQGAGLLQLRSVGPALWASWVDNTTGLRFAKIP